MSNGNELAYPILETEAGVNLHEGLTKREHFAAMAMQGLLSRGYGMHENGGYEQRMSNRAVNIADALLRELDK